MQSLKAMRTLKLVVDGKQAGRVVQGCLSDDLKRLEGIWMDSGLGGLRFIDADHISVIGRRSVIADESGIRLRIRPHSLFIRAVSSGGRRLGAIIDAQIDETSLTVASLTLSNGYIDSLLHGYSPITVFFHDRANCQVIIPGDEIDQEVFG
jgi:uncharacterized protein YrrD